jgi:hypothetical protein
MRKFFFITESKEFWSMWRFVGLNISVTNMLQKRSTTWVRMTLVLQFEALL